MIESQSVMALVHELLQSRGHVSARNFKNGKPWSSGSVTLHTAIRIACDMDPNDSVFAYWQWRELQTLLSEVWGVFDAAVAKFTGDSRTAVVWFNEANRSAEEISALFDLCAARSLVQIPKVTRRPRRNPKFVPGGDVSPARSSFLLGDGTLRTSLAVALVVLKEVSETPYGDLFSSFAEFPGSDEELLAAVDDRVLSIVGDPDRIAEPVSLVVARLLVQALNSESELLEAESDRMKALVYGEFFSLTDGGANWGGMTDVAVIDRLLKISGKEVGAPLVEGVERAIQGLRGLWS